MIRLAVLGLLFSFNAQAALSIGSSLPSQDTVMKSADGKNVKLSELSKDKKGTLVVFSCNTCPYAKAWKDRLIEIGKDAVSKGMAVVVINANDSANNPKENIEAMEKQLFPFPYVVDATSNVAREFGATKTPDVFLFNKDKKLVYMGAVDDSGEDASKVKETYLKTAIGQLLAGQTVTPETTKAVGCGIKFRN